jgi:CxxC motif-containing protein (DUF1111 family)
MWEPMRNHRAPSGVLKKLGVGALGICGVALIGVASVGVGAAARQEPQEAPRGKAVGKVAGKAQEAPTGFDNQTNGFEEQAKFDDDRDSFEEVEDILPGPDGTGGGLGPVYNATSCVSCHQNPVTGGSSQIAELRAGHRTPDPGSPSPRKVEFVEAAGGSVIQQRAIDASIQEHVQPEDDVRTLRMSNTVLGNGFVEVIPDEEILRVRRGQRRWGMEGFAVVVTAAVGPKPGGGPTDFVLVERIGRFGWKCQEASLVNFSAGAYLNEMGITSPLQPTENTSNGRDVSSFDKVPDPEDKAVDPKKPNEKHPFGVDVEAFTRFMRSTKAPPRDAAVVGNDDVKAGEALFRDNEKLGCAICHHPDYTTPPPGTPIHTLGGRRGSDMATVPEALGNKVIHPYSDFLLHDVGTGDGIAQTQHADLPPRGFEDRERIPEEIQTRDDLVRVRARPERGHRRVLSGLEQRTADKMRTAPLWGLRARPQLMHDGLSLTIDEAIRRHGGQAEGVRLKYEALSDQEKKLLLAFLNSL